MKLTLYYAPVACSMVPYINLSEAGADFEVVAINFRAGQHHGPEYLQVNPKHKVPALVIDGEVLTENVAINLSIARTFPQARLLPADAKQEWQAVALMAWCASSIHPALTPNNNPARFCETQLGGERQAVRPAAARRKLHPGRHPTCGPRVVLSPLHGARRLLLLDLSTRHPL